jgi:hypothetical protein
MPARSEGANQRTGIEDQGAHERTGLVGLDLNHADVTPSSRPGPLASPERRTAPETRGCSRGPPANLAVVLRPWLLAETPTRHAGALEQLAVLLLGHPLTPLLDDRTHAVAFRLSASDKSCIDDSCIDETGRFARPIAETTSGDDTSTARAGGRDG